MIKNITNQNQNQKGYAILFTVVMVSVISAIALGIANSNYKQQILSSITKDSITAFYQADTAADCALYFDVDSGKDPISTPLWSCGLRPDGSVYNLTRKNPTTIGTKTTYTFEPTSGFIATDPCFSFDLIKDSTGPTSIKAYGLSLCNKNNLKTVEREIDISY